MKHRSRFLQIRKRQLLSLNRSGVYILVPSVNNLRAKRLAIICITFLLIFSVAFGVWIIIN